MEPIGSSHPVPPPGDFPKLPDSSSASDAKAALNNILDQFQGEYPSFIVGLLNLTGDPVSTIVNYINKNLYNYVQTIASYVNGLPNNETGFQAKQFLNGSTLTPNALLPWLGSPGTVSGNTVSGESGVLGDLVNAMQSGQDPTSLLNQLDYVLSPNPSSQESSSSLQSLRENMWGSGDPSTIPIVYYGLLGWIGTQ